MNQAQKCLPVIAVACFALPCLAQTGTVTFYSIGLSAKQKVKVSIAPTGEAPFSGWLFDGDKKMAHASAGRFMTFQLAVGGHDFTAPYKSVRGKFPLHLDLENGRHYCVRLSAKYVSPVPIVVPISFFNSKIEEISCQQAVQEAGSYERIDLKRVEPSARAALDSSPNFPQGN